jgi:hypothetical protein
MFKNFQFPDAIVESEDVIAASNLILSQLELHAELQTHDYTQPTAQQQGMVAHLTS